MLYRRKRFKRVNCRKRMDNLKSVRQGKYFELEVNDSDQDQAEKKVDDMCKKLLANLIIEDYKINKI